MLVSPARKGGWPVFPGRSPVVRFFYTGGEAAHLHPLNPVNLLNPLNPHARKGVSKRASFHQPVNIIAHGEEEESQKDGDSNGLDVVEGFFGKFSSAYAFD